MNYSDWVLASATVLGPILAVQAQKWVERAREKRNRKNWVFLTLMATRAARLSGDHVTALNTIDLAFYGRRVFGIHQRSKKEQLVIDAWREYYDHLNSGPQDSALEAVKIQWGARRDELFINLLQALACALAYEFDRVQLQKGAYSPMAHGALELEQQAIRALAVKVLAGQQPLVVEMKGAAQAQSG